MTMGQRIRQARLAAGLSQRQLAGQEITRNMLSALENDSAKPSLATLQYLSDKLCKPISYFLGEDEPAQPGAAEMEQARAALASGEYKMCLELAARVPGGAFTQERELLEGMARLKLAREQIRLGNLPYARSLLEEMEALSSPYCRLLRREQRIAYAQAIQDPARRALAVSRIEPEDEVLLLRAEAALTDGAAERAEALLRAAADQRSPQWNYLMGRALFARQEYEPAAQCFHRAETQMERQVRHYLEVCCRELGDYKSAYYYATKK